ncbi:hypothetical protein CEP54_009403 [Fusarium duplospermum]|uniref:AAA+ ATPase domain-containing protein n=1 Tax=Fusarium duplospermum TaxID=1325734 RepID=A0A428PQI5_9HYPO|nr:hypothetical protein CEP54_009403 [Fusarium duplospermum]
MSAATLVDVPPASPESAVAALPTSAGTAEPGEVNNPSLLQEPEKGAASVAVEYTEEHQESDQVSGRDDSKDDSQQPRLPTDTEPHEGSKEAERAFLDLFRNLQSKTYPGRFHGREIEIAHDYILSHEQDMSLDWRTRRARQLSFTLLAYFRLLEDRLVSLEDERLDPKLKRSPSPSEGSSRGADMDADEANGAIPTLNRVAWPEFKRKYPEKRNPSQVHAIDVLVSNPVIPHEVWNDRVARSHPRHLDSLDRRIRLFQMFGEHDPFGEFDDSNGAGSATRNEPAMAQIPRDSYQAIPDRIRINRAPLKRLLEKALEVDLKDGPIVLLKPFKLLVKYGARIRSLHAQLERKFGQQSSQPTDPDEQDHTEDNPVRYPGDDNDVGTSLLDAYGTKQAYQQLGCLIEFMNHDLGTLKHFANSSATKISFSDLWHIFQAGVAVVTGHKPIDAYRVLHVTGGRPYLSPPKDEDEGENETIMKAYRVPAKSSDFVITCYQIGFDGNKFGPVTKSFSIQKYDGFQDIRSLPIYPLSFARDPSDLRKKLSENGEMFIKLSKVGHVLYRGLNLHEAEEIDSEIIVDFHAALWDNQDKDDEWHDKYQVDFGIQTLPNADQAEVVMVSRGGCKEPGCCENDQVFNDLDLDHRFIEEYLAENEFPTTDARYLTDDPIRIPQDDLILFPHRLFAFVLKDRKWAVVDINNITELPESTGEAWKSLVLPGGHKEMVYSLVQSHFRSKDTGRAEEEMQADLIRGKGKGLIVLLHGAPGVGKTSTAECVADLCRKPLYPITCGDLGITAVEVETRLKRIFVQAQKWECVLLLDEADVFLSERSNDVKHNSLVSVFLRVLEYYKGILFLTTNRVGRMDEAFRSRVHVSLYYPPLNEQSTLDIFRINIERTEKRKGDKMKLEKSNIEDFALDHYQANDQRVRWNGRQIRNAFHIAVALAENEAVEKANQPGKKYRRPKLRARHFLTVEKASSEFDNYLVSVLGMGQADRAKQNSHRRDDWRQERSNDHRESKQSRTKTSTRRRKDWDTSDSSDDSSSEEDQPETEGQSGSSEESKDERDIPVKGRGRSGKSKRNCDYDESEDAQSSRERKGGKAKKSSRDRRLRDERRRR